MGFLLFLNFSWTKKPTELNSTPWRIFCAVRTFFPTNRLNFGQWAVRWKIIKTESRLRLCWTSSRLKPIYHVKIGLFRSQKSSKSTKIGFWSSNMRDFEVDGHELYAKLIMIKHEYILQYFWHLFQVKAYIIYNMLHTI